MVELDYIKDDIAEIKTTVNGIFRILNGNGSVGLCTKVELHELKLNQFPTPTQMKWYAGVGGGVIFVVTLLGYAVVSLFVH